jgi:ATP-dependent Clp protease ATP-binding subunit ClpA
MLKRRIRSEVEAKLATAILNGDVKPGDRVRLSYDPKEGVNLVEDKPQKEEVQMAA